MNTRVLATLGVLSAFGLVLQAQQSAPSPRTSWGDPDLQGTWTSQAELSVPFERPPEFGERRVLTDEELPRAARRSTAELEADNAQFDVATADRSTAGQVGRRPRPRRTGSSAAGVAPHVVGDRSAGRPDPSADNGG